MPSTRKLAPSAADREALAALDKKLNLVRDRVSSVVHGFQTGLYLCGAGGLGKSYNVHHQLLELEVEFHIFNSRMTAKGLFCQLERYPDAIHVLEDMERITDDRDAQSVLRSALWSQPGQERAITWTTGDGERRCMFRGGIIMLANRPMRDLPELRALATRIPVHKLEISDAEMAAQARRLAADGFSRGRHKLDAQHCLIVCDYLIAECRECNCPLDMRLLENSFLDYLQYEHSRSACHWHDLVTNRVRQSASHFRHSVDTMSREERLDHERGIVRTICGQTEDAQERVRLWRE